MKLTIRDAFPDPLYYMTLVSGSSSFRVIDILTAWLGVKCCMTLDRPINRGRCGPFCVNFNTQSI